MLHNCVSLSLGIHASLGAFSSSHYSNMDLPGATQSALPNEAARVTYSALQMIIIYLCQTYSTV